MLALALLAACGNPEITGTFTTYNAGLAVGFVPGAAEREPLVADAIAGLEADVVCLQEVWLPGQIEAVRAATAGAFPHDFFPATQQVVEDVPACPGGALDALISCATDNCEDACSDELVSCVQGSCPFQFIGLPTNCLGCTMANVGGEIPAIQEACETRTTHYAYGGSFGTGILSRHPIASTAEQVFESTTNRRSALHAVIELPSGPIDVYCTHLTAVFGSIPYPRDTGSWQEEQAQQVQDLRAWVDATSTGPVVLMGDFNAGPATPGVVATQSANYNALAAGYVNPYVDLDGRCTFCADNPLLALSADDDESELIDHVLVRGLPEATFAARRVLDQSVQHGTCGVDVDGAYSDHYGVEVTINPEG